ncbi:Hypothetical protein LUCI_2386 [Lucifera butyrica]|uniref:Gp5/Type VI secretion system Vgr protein OB-fold domain-containing protein n=1 Tax=Lucifera butyrica TaxID=1351585 RepID=A0A498RA29_9FIRM|nr:hypothetical protein [Lucifera butyrica]VBB07142.1 Hypothetical protein LUCI_2386 [Lucifera butyrica]
MESANQQEQTMLPSEGKAINWHHLHFSPYPLQHILAVEITQAINEHARLYIRGTLPDNGMDPRRDYVQTTTENSPVTLTYTDHSGAEKCLFKGLVTNIQQQVEGGLKYLEIEAVSFSFQLDVIRQSRSFQRQQEPYQYIFDRINAGARDYVPNLNGNVLFVPEGRDRQTTGKLILQYEETDWMFLKRLASFFNIGLVPDITFECPKIYFGLPPQPAGNQDDNKGQEGENQEGPQINVSSYKIYRDTKRYAEASKNTRKNSGTALSENDFTYCIVESLDVLRLGQKVNFLNLDFYVMNSRIRMEEGAVNNTYTLATQKGLMQDDLYNPNLAGISLKGIIKEVKNDQVRVYISSIDQTWDDGATWFYPYTTVYSSPDGSGWYCMPEVGDNVRLYFPNHKEAEAVAVSSVNLTPSKRGARTDPDSKIISTVHGKQLILNPGGIEIIANDQLLMTLTDDGGVSIRSDKKITLEAEEDIEITSKTSKITVSAMDEISIQQGAGEINMKQDINLCGAKVNVQQ